MDSVSGGIALFRMSERIALTIIIVTIAVIVMAGFWKTIQKFDFSSNNVVPGFAGSIAVTTPLVVLGILVIYAWVSLSHPITSVNGPITARESSPIPTGLATTNSESQVNSFTGMTGDDIGVRQERVIKQIKILNCLMPSTPSDDQQDELSRIKFTLMSTVWTNDWGDRGTFEKWAQGLGETASQSAIDVFDREFSKC